MECHCHPGSSPDGVSMAAQVATEQPSFNSAWDALRKHFPTIFGIWAITIVLSLVGFCLYMLIAFLVAIVMSSPSGDVSEAAVTAASMLAQVAQLPFALLSSLVGVLFMAVPALYYETGEVITLGKAFSVLFKRPWRYLVAGLFFSVVSTIGFGFCVLPGIVIALIVPIYVNRIFLTEMGIGDSFASSFQAMYRSPAGRSFLVAELLTWLLVMLVSICTCGLGTLIAIPMAGFYLQNLAYHQGVVS